MNILYNNACMWMNLWFLGEQLEVELRDPSVGICFAAEVFHTSMGDGLRSQGNPIFLSLCGVLPIHLGGNYFSSCDMVNRCDFNLNFCDILTGYIYIFLNKIQFQSLIHLKLACLQFIYSGEQLFCQLQLLQIFSPSLWFCPFVFLMIFFNGHKL